jgi:hypothetical protein
MPLSKCNKLEVWNLFSVKLNFVFLKNMKDVYILEKSSLIVPYGHSMKKIILFKFGFCKIFGINDILNTIITQVVSYQMDNLVRWQ